VPSMLSSRPSPTGWAGGADLDNHVLTTRMGVRPGGAEARVKTRGLKDGRRMRVLDASMPMTRDEVLATLELHAQELRRLGAKSLALFGSVARDEGTESSDIDVLVELEPKTFDAYMDVKLFLERVLGRRIDLVLADAVKPRLRSVILEGAVPASRS